MGDELRPGSYLIRPRLIALDMACAPLARAYGLGVYLVGSCLLRPDYRDVDVRVLLSAKEWAGMFPGVDPAKPFLASSCWELLCLALSEYLSRAAHRLPIDFQFQEVDAANAAYGKEPRVALGIRDLESMTPVRGGEVDDG